VLETLRKEEEKKPKRLGWVQPNLSSVWHTGLSGGAPNSVRCTRQVSGEKVALEKSSAAYDYNSPDCPVSQQSPAQLSVAQSTGDAWPAPTVGRGHRTVRCAPDSVWCANWPRAATVVCARKGKRSAPDRVQRLSGGAPDCPVRHSTEGKDGLPCWPPTAPSCLGAIKGTPRRMEEIYKHSLSILRHPDFVPAHSFHRVSDLSSIRVEDSLCCHLSSSPLLCAWVCCDLCLVCVVHPNLTLCFHCDLCCKGERL
jgi:hypothetical protein